MAFFGPETPLVSGGSTFLTSSTYKWSFSCGNAISKQRMHLNDSLHLCTNGVLAVEMPLMSGGCNFLAASI